MNAGDAPYYRAQVKTKYHGTPVADDALSGDAADLRRLAHGCLSTVSSFYGGPHLDEEKHFLHPHLAGLFYKKYYLEPQIVGYITRTPLKVDDLLERYVAGTENPDSNLLLLLGEVGVGKTSFLNNVITRHLSQEKWKQTIWFCRVDADPSHSDYHVARSAFLVVELLRMVAYKLHWIVKSYAGQLAPGHEEELQARAEAMKVAAGGTAKDAPPLPDVICDKIKSLITWVHEKTGKKFLLIFDNVDYLSHLADRERFFPGITPEETQALQNAFALLHDIYSNKLFSRKVGSALIALRPETKAFLDSNKKISEITTYKRAEMFELPKVDALPAVKARMRMMRDVAGMRLFHGNKAGLQEKATQWIDSIDHYLGLDLSDKEGRPLFTTLTNLSAFGLRSLLDHIQAHTLWLACGMGDDVKKTRQRYETAGSEHIGILLTLLNRHALFSQQVTHFPNIYLCSMLRKRTDTPACNVHGYWLKYLLLEYIASVRNGQTLKAILSVFCLNKDGWEPYMIRECLGSLYNQLGSSVINVKGAAGHNGDGVEQILISENERGQFLRNNVLSSFVYLQVVIDDDLMHYPSAASSLIIEEKGDWDYRYLYPSLHVSGRGTTEMLRHKSRQVLVFLDLLEASLEVEKTQRPMTMRGLAAFAPLPSVQRMREKVITEILALARNTKDDEIDRIVEEADRKHRQQVQVFTEAMTVAHIRARDYCDSHSRAEMPKSFSIEEAERTIKSHA